MGSDVISSRTNARVKQLRAAFQGQARLSGGLIAIEGDHLLEEALRSGMVLKTVFVSELREVPKIVPRGVEVMRPTEAFGATGVLTTPGTVSAWNQKALRASVGSVFRVPVVAVAASDIEELKQRSLRLIAAVGFEDSGVIAVQEMDFTAGCAVMIGNEGSGLGAEWMEMCDARVTIPCPGAVESLNAAVAGSLLLYEASRQRTMARGSGR